MRNLTSFRYRSLFLKFLIQSLSKLLRFEVDSSDEASRASLIDLNSHKKTRIRLMRLWNFVCVKCSREKGMNQRNGTRGSLDASTAIVKPGERLSVVVIMELNLELTQNLITGVEAGNAQF